MNFLRRLQDLPGREKKIILWAVMIVVGILLLTFYIKYFRQNLKNFNTEGIKEELKILKLQERLKEIPKFEIPNLEMPKTSDEELKNLEDETQENPASCQ